MPNNRDDRRRPTDAELDAESVITLADLDVAVASWRQHAPPEARGLLDAEPTARADDAATP